VRLSDFQVGDLIRLNSGIDARIVSFSETEAELLLHRSGAKYRVNKEREAKLSPLAEKE
jgi:preprotein translocase subunit YajC